jgi:hypothetical protein
MLVLLAATTVAFTGPSALAQDQINLGGELVGTLAFVAEGGGNFSFGLCDNLNGKKKCVSGDTVIGKATGTGAFAGDNGFYILQGNGLTTGSLNSCGGGTCNWTLSTGSPLSFEFRQFKNGSGTDFLDGTLKMTGLSEVASGKVFLETITIDLTVTGCSIY